jgi:hypothetical protein
MIHHCTVCQGPGHQCYRLADGEWLKVHLAEGGDAQDLPGHCRLCGQGVEPGVFLMHDPDGRAEPISFCSQVCLDKAERALEGLSVKQLEALEVALGMLDPAVRH